VCDLEVRNNYYLEGGTIKTIEVQHQQKQVKKKKGLWGNNDFMLFWVGQTLSLFGSQITVMALPLIAAISLNATPFQMGVLRTVEYAPFLLFGLFAGVWVDYLPKRLLLISMDFCRAAILLIIPILFVLGSLNMLSLWIVAFLTGICTTFYAICYQSFVPYILEKDQLTDGNSKLELSRSISESSGPGLAGILVQLFTGAFAIILNAVSSVISGILLLFLKVDEPKRDKNDRLNSNVWKEIGEGLGFVFKNRYLSAIAGCSATTNFFLNILLAILILYATKEIGLSPALVGLLMTLSSIGAVISAFISNKIIVRFGFGAVIVGSSFFQGLGGLFFLGAMGSKTFAFLMMCIALFIVTFSMTIYNVAQVSFRQMITEKKVLGRMNATMRTLVWGSIPLGAFTGGILGTWIGLYPTIVVAVCGGMFSFLWVLLSPVRKVTDGNMVAVEK
jgi:Na+/melibiose symporter-like transporter